LISLELILHLLDTLRAETIDGLSSPGNPTEFGFGTIHGQMKTIEEMHSRLSDLVEQSHNSGNEGHNDSSEDQDDYQI